MILQETSEANLFKDLLKTVVHNIGEIELPVVPFFLKEMHSLMEDKFKVYFKLFYEKDQMHKVPTKEIYCLDNIGLLLELIHQIGN